MFRTVEIAPALTEAWLRNGVPNKTPREVADFYSALYDAVEESKRKEVAKSRSMDATIQLTCGAVVALLTTIWILLATFCEMRLLG
jgi:hypothetical protein